MRLIDADALHKTKIVERKKIFIDGKPKTTNIYTEVVRIREIEAAPTIEAEPVKHGRWERTEDGAAYCTAHKGKLNPHCYGYGYCPYCGARMDKGDE